MRPDFPPFFAGQIKGLFIQSTTTNANVAIASFVVALGINGFIQIAYRGNPMRTPRSRSWSRSCSWSVETGLNRVSIHNSEKPATNEHWKKFSDFLCNG